MRLLGLPMMLILLMGRAHAAESSRFPGPKEFTGHAFHASAFVLSGLGTAVGQIGNSPREWGQGPDGAAKRFGAIFGKHLVKSSIQLSVAGLRDEDLKYHPSDRPGFGSRLQHALVSTVVARDKMDGSSTIAMGRIAGAFGSGFVSELWLPARLHTVSNGLASGGVVIGVNALMNIVREFVPQVRRHLQHQ